MEKFKEEDEKVKKIIDHEIEDKMRKWFDERFTGNNGATLKVICKGAYIEYNENDSNETLQKMF